MEHFHLTTWQQTDLEVDEYPRFQQPQTHIQIQIQKKCKALTVVNKRKRHCVFRDAFTTIDSRHFTSQSSLLLGMILSLGPWSLGSSRRRCCCVGGEGQWVEMMRGEERLQHFSPPSYPKLYE